MADNHLLYCSVFDLEIDRGARPEAYAFFAAIENRQLDTALRQRVLPPALQRLEPNDPPGYVELTEWHLILPGRNPADVWTVRHFRSWGHEDYWAHFGWLYDLWICSLHRERNAVRCLGTSIRGGDPVMTYCAIPSGLEIRSYSADDGFMSWSELDEYLAASD